MSIAKVVHVGRSQKEYRCERCGETIPKGSSYRKFTVGFRSNYTHRRCMESACTPTRGELDASKMASVWDAQDDFEKALDEAGTVDDLRSALEDYAGALRDVAEEYEQASQNEHGVVFNVDAEERAEMLNSAADEVEGIDIEDPEDVVDCEVCGGTGEGDPCDECDGTGLIGAETCDNCGGAGKMACSVEDCDDGRVNASEEALDEQLEEQREEARAALDVELP